jgi:hypothetical protein
MRKLHELPVPVGIIGDVSVDYVRERDALHTAAELRAFVQRWQAIWGLADGSKSASPVAQLLAAGGEHFDYEAALACMQQCRVHESGCTHVNDAVGCPGLHIMLPSVLASANLFARNFGVPLNTALVQLQRAHHNYDEAQEWRRLEGEAAP